MAAPESDGMTSVREFFTTEATEYLDKLSSLTTALNDSTADPSEFHKVTRALRGSAQMAREDRMYRVAVALEGSARALATQTLPWSSDLSEKVTLTIEDMRALIYAGEHDEAADLRASEAVRRLASDGSETTAEVVQPGVDAQFRSWAASEVAGIAAELDSALQALARDPRNRDPLRSIMRRQRALSGAAQLSLVPTVAETLRALEDITRLIVRLDVAVKAEWLDAYRSARDVLVAATASLRIGQTPGQVPALNRIRALREELLERHGPGEEAPAGTASDAVTAHVNEQPPASVTGPASPVPLSHLGQPGVTPAGTTPAGVAPDETGVVPVEAVIYRGEAALRRALELREEIERTKGSEPAHSQALAELFDLIELARK
jgi:chemotaxis protein histidine kinase CheA